MADPKYIPGLAARVLRQIEEHPETWDQDALPDLAEEGAPTCVGGHCARICGDPADYSWPWRARTRLAVPVMWAWRNLFNSGIDPKPALRQLAARDEYMRTRSGGMGNGFCSALKEVYRG